MINDFRGDYRWLSNFHVCDVTIDWCGKPRTYTSSEAAFMAAKTLDLEEERAIRLASTPREAKALGRKATLRPNWDNIRVDVMRAVLRAKFTQNPDLAELLLATGTEELVEGNWWHDYFWGVCNGRGENWLGRILMEIRTELKEN